MAYRFFADNELDAGGRKPRGQPQQQQRDIRQTAARTRDENSLQGHPVRRRHDVRILASTRTQLPPSMSTRNRRNLIQTGLDRRSAASSGRNCPIRRTDDGGRRILRLSRPRQVSISEIAATRYGAAICHPSNCPLPAARLRTKRAVAGRTGDIVVATALLLK